MPIQADDGARRLILADAVAALEATRCVWKRATMWSGKLYVEGWLERPDDDGPFEPLNLPIDRQI